ncbi:MAG: FtsK/SpoIIIE domain-containing protein [Pirellulales bacterium]
MRILKLIEPNLSTRHVLELMLDLQQLADQRAQAETAIAARGEKERSAAEQEYSTNNQRLHDQHTIDHRDLENEFAQAKLQAVDKYDQLQQSALQQHDQSIQQINSRCAQISADAAQKRQEASWQAHAVFDASKDKPQQKLQETNKQLDRCWQQMMGLQRDAQTLLIRRRLKQIMEEVPTDALPQSGKRDTQTTELSNSAPSIPPTKRSPAEKDQLLETIHQLHQEVLTLESQRLPTLLLEGWRWLTWWLMTCLLVAIPSWFGFSSIVAWSVIALMGGGVLTIIAYALLYPHCRRQSLQQFKVFGELLHIAGKQHRTASDHAKNTSLQETQSIIQNRDNDLETAESEHRQTIASAQSDQQIKIERIESQFQTQSNQYLVQREEALETADKKFSSLLKQLAIQYQSACAKTKQTYTCRCSQVEQEEKDSWHDMAEQWQQGFQKIASQLDALNEICSQQFPNWEETTWQQWQRPEEPLRTIRFGHYQLPLSAVKNGLSANQRLHPEKTTLEIPALLSLDEQPRLILSASGQDRAKATHLLQMVMLRFLTALPAGKLRMTILDPAGLGNNFAAFMHLADIDEQLIGPRIWTDGRQLEEQLSLLCEHLETVLQKYLRNEFATIDQYNQQAGEVAEPYHLVVVANFPNGFSDAAIEKLLKIVTGGPRCGVYPLISLDTQLKLPNLFHQQEWLQEAVSIVWQNGKPFWNYPLFEKLTLKLDTLPSADRFTEVLRAVGHESHEANRVEVPFSLVTPPQDQLWGRDSSRELTVPIGRAGANHLQSLRLGIGTAQHVLISGKTGSGKSSLLHALITNLALHYSPEQVVFYLVDFKKGVEFKAYATGELPHARVIAVESEREFGVSVLERLDVELRQRGELYRNLGVQDLAGYREKKQESGKRKAESGGQRPGVRGEKSEVGEVKLPPLPRVLLVIDEFQELFVTDDKLAQDAALLLDRLVRQGRAFGIHVLLGSQTLSGAYSLARSTLGQMAVRIALECSDADAHLILSDDNSAALRLHHPGEAIYNDQNGFVAGNQPFQVVWLPDDQRQQYLAQVRTQQLTTEAMHAGRKICPPIVFEGNLPADPHDNHALQQVLATQSIRPVSEPTIWLGSSVRIEPPTELTFRRQGGNHLLIVGQADPFGILATAVETLVAYGNTDLTHGNPGPMHLTIFDGARPESDAYQKWLQLIETLPTATRNCETHVLQPGGIQDVINQLADEIARRSLDTNKVYPPHYLVIYDLAQFRELRRTEDDFSFSSSSSKSVSIDHRFREIIREGPAVGVHLLMWCESYNSLTRSIDRLTLRDIDYRIVLPMSAADSSSLIDSPEAGHLGENRALFYRDDLGTHTKFRPYAAAAPQRVEKRK